MKNIFFLLIIIYLSSCVLHTSEESRFSEIDFTYDDMWKESFSIKINSTGKVYLGCGIKNRKYFTTSIHRDTLSICDSIVKSLQEMAIKPLYREEGDDMEKYRIKIVTHDTIIDITIHADSIPKQVERMRQLLKQIKNNHSFTELDSMVTFESLKHFYPANIEKYINDQNKTPLGRGVH